LDVSAQEQYDTARRQVTVSIQKLIALHVVRDERGIPVDPQYFSRVTPSTASAP
jgi:hypothetical protein